MDPPSKMQNQDDRTSKTSSYEISFWVLSRASVATVTNNEMCQKILVKY